jgi:hypothetical protein
LADHAGAQEPNGAGERHVRGWPLDFHFGKPGPMGPADNVILGVLHDVMISQRYSVDVIISIDEGSGVHKIPVNSIDAVIQLIIVGISDVASKRKNQFDLE